MRSVRCDACGTKALIAASKCPKCAHEIEVRDGFGEMLPLSHCSTCDSFYPARVGACRWCGTKPERAPVGPYVWKGIGVATFVAMAWGAWLVHDDPPADVSKARLAAVLKPDSAAGALDSSMLAAAMTDSVAADTAAAFDSTAILASDSTIQSVASVVVAIGDSMNQPPVLPVVAADSAPTVVAPVVAPVEAVTERVAEPERVLPPVEATPRPALATRNRVVSPEKAGVPAPATKSRAVARAPERAVTNTPTRKTTKATTKAPSRAVAVAKTPVKSARKPVAKPPAKAVAKPPAKVVARAAAKAPAKPRATRSVWVSTVARNWVVVRSGADRGSRVVASIGPNTRVQLGESRNGWRRIRAKGLAGWVEHRSFFAGGAGSRKTGSLAAR